MKKYAYTTLLLGLLLFGSRTDLRSQTAEFPESQAELEQLILELDRQFWEAYNACEVETMMSFITEDLEFYHDKAGLSIGAATMEEGLKRGLCNPDEPKLRREEIAGTVAVFPMAKTGALIRGEHRFHVTLPGQEEFLDGQAQFMHFWRYEDGKWQMARVFSYDHGPAQQE
ncbi:MAG: nuclear transport factor 2 family protein [Bacteroidota bacterium]